MSDDIRKILETESTLVFQKETHYGYEKSSTPEVHLVKILANIGLLLCDIRDELMKPQPTKTTTTKNGNYPE